MTMDDEEREGMDVWDKLRQSIGNATAPRQRPWYQHPNAPSQEEIDRQRRVPQPRRKPNVPPDMPPNRGDQRWWQDKRIPRQWQDQTTPSRPPRTGQDGTSAYNDTADQERLMRGAYAAGLNGDEGAAQSFPPGSPFERAYRQGLRDRQMSRGGAGA